MLWSTCGGIKEACNTRPSKKKKSNILCLLGIVTTQIQVWTLMYSRQSIKLTLVIPVGRETSCSDCWPDYVVESGVSAPLTGCSLHSEEKLLILKMVMYLSPYLRALWLHILLQEKFRSGLSSVELCCSSSAFLSHSWALLLPGSRSQRGTRESI